MQEIAILVADLSWLLGKRHNMVCHFAADDTTPCFCPVQGLKYLPIQFEAHAMYRVL